MNSVLASALDSLDREFAFPADRMRRMMDSVQAEMEAGLSGQAGSLRMLPTFADNPSGRETGDVLALDLGGTNVRLLWVRLPGNGLPPVVQSRGFKIGRESISADADVLFGEIARHVGEFMSGFGLTGTYGLGFTFSFAIRQNSIRRGELIRWTKGWTASGVEGRDVVALLDRALVREGLAGVGVVSLNNDTTGTQVARAYIDPDCDAGCILGTGTNVCYRERTARIRKPIGDYGREFMIINMESGNFDKDLPRTRFDDLLDARSENPGGQWEEKMVSGKYLGELVRLAVLDGIGRGLLFGGRTPAVFAEAERFSSEMVSAVESDLSSGAAEAQTILRRLGADGSADDAAAVRGIGRVVTRRAARVAAVVLAAVAARNDPNLERVHAIAVDGSVFEKTPGFAEDMARAFRELFGPAATRIRTELTHDGSGLGAAVIAASVGRGRSA